MGFSRNANTITQTGADPTLSNLAGISGVSVDTSGTKYTLSGVRMDIAGDLIIDPEENELIFDATCPYPHYTIKSGGSLQIGRKKETNGIVSYSKGSAISSVRTTGGGIPTFNMDQYGLGNSENNATFKAFGGVINTPSSIAIVGSHANKSATGCTVEIESLTVNNTCSLTSLGNRLLALYFDENASTIASLNIAVTGITNAFEIRNDAGLNNASFDLEFSSINTDFQAIAPKTFVNMGFAKNRSNYDIRPRVSKGGGKFYDKYTDSDVGSSVRVENNSVDRKGQGFFYSTLNIKSKDVLGNNVDAVFYLSDNVGANVFTPFSNPADFDISAPINYSTTAVNGQATLNILLGGYNKVSNEFPISHFRSISGNDADDFSIEAASYRHLLLDIPFIAKGKGGVDIAATFTVDGTISEYSKSIVDAYTDTETSQKLYDKAKAYLIDNFTTVRDFLITREGDTSKSNYNITIDADPAAEFGVVGNTIKVKASIFYGNIDTTGNVTLLNGAKIEGAVFSATQDSVLREANGATFTVYASESDRDARTNPIVSGVTNYDFLFSALPSNPLYLWVTSGVTELPFTANIVKGLNEFDLGIGGSLVQISSNLKVINKGVQKSSLLIPHSENV